MRKFTPTLDPSQIEVPGLDPNAPYEDQIELLDQLITLKLQETDAHWAEIHNIIINQLLPAVKRYSQNSQPTREAAHFWKTFYETAANIKLPTPGGETSVSYEQQEQEQEQEESVREDEGTADGSFASDHTPTNPNYSFNPAVASTPGRLLGQGHPDDSDADLTSASSVSSFPTFAVSIGHNAEPTSSAISSSSLFGGPQGRDDTQSNQSTASTSYSSLQVFSNSPSPDKKGKGKAKVELREQLLRQKHRKAATPVRAKNPFRRSTVPTPHGDVIDLSRYSPSSSDATVQLDLSPKTKLKVFSTPQYKLALRSKEEAVAIQMSEARARASDYSSSGDFSAPPTPMSAHRRVRQQQNERAVLQARFDRDMARRAGHSTVDDSDEDEDDGPASGAFSDSDSFSDDDGGGDDTLDMSSAQGLSNLNNFSLPPIDTDDSQRPFNSDSDSFSGDSLDGGDQLIRQPMSNVSLASRDAPPASGANTGGRPLLSYDDDMDEYSTMSSDHRMENTGPTETLFGFRPADKHITEADWERKLSRPLPGRVLPDQPLDSPTPADPAGAKRGSGPGRGRF